MIVKSLLCFYSSQIFEKGNIPGKLEVIFLSFLREFQGSSSLGMFPETFSWTSECFKKDKDITTGLPKETKSIQLQEAQLWSNLEDLKGVKTTDLRIHGFLHSWKGFSRMNLPQIMTPHWYSAQIFQTWWTCKGSLKKACFFKGKCSRIQIDLNSNFSA